MGLFDKFKIGFKKSADAFSSGLKEIIYTFLQDKWVRIIKSKV